MFHLIFPCVFQLNSLGYTKPGQPENPRVNRFWPVPFLLHKSTVSTKPAAAGLPIKFKRYSSMMETTTTMNGQPTDSGHTCNQIKVQTNLCKPLLGTPPRYLLFRGGSAIRVTNACSSAHETWNYG